MSGFFNWRIQLNKWKLIINGSISSSGHKTVNLKLNNHFPIVTEMSTGCSCFLKACQCRINGLTACLSLQLLTTTLSSLRNWMKTLELHKHNLDDFKWDGKTINSVTWTIHTYRWSTWTLYDREPYCLQMNSRNLKKILAKVTFSQQSEVALC